MDNLKDFEMPQFNWSVLYQITEIVSTNKFFILVCFASYFLADNPSVAMIGIDTILRIYSRSISTSRIYADSAFLAAISYNYYKDK